MTFATVSGSGERRRGLRTAGYAWRRSRAHAGLVALLLAMAALVCACIAGTLGYLDVGLTTGLREAVAAAPPTAQVHQVQTRLADDPQAQQSGARAVFAETLPPDAAIWTSVRTPPLPLADSDDRAILLVDDGAPEHASLTSGVWASARGETTLHAGAAESLGLGVGDRVTVTSEDSAVELTVVGLWLPDDPDDPHWGGDLLVRSGADPLSADTYGPWLVAADALQPLSVAPFVLWTITTGPELAPDSLDAWIRGLDDVAGALDEAGLTVRGVATSGTLATTLADAQESVASVRASSAIPLLVVALVSLVALWQIARLLAAVRERETLVLLSRGAAPGQLVGVGAAEAAAVAVGAVLGGLAVALVYAGRDGYRPTTTASVTLAVALAVIAIMVAVLARAAATGLHPEGESGRTRAALAIGALALVGALAAFSLWRFIRNGSPLVPGTQQIDVIAVAGPALGLIAVALVAVALAAPLSRGLAAAGARRPGFSPVTELRQSSRRITVNAVPVVLVVLAAAIATIASGYAGTWQALRTASMQTSTGADVRVETSGGLVHDQPQGVEAVSEAADGAATTGVLQAALRVDERVGQLSGVVMSELGVSSAPPELLDPAAAALTPTTDPLPGIDLPPDATELTLTSTVSASGERGDGSTRGVAFRVWLAQGSELVALWFDPVVVQAADGEAWDPDAMEVVPVPNPDKGEPVTSVQRTELVAGTWRVVAVDTSMDTSTRPTQWSVTIDSLMIDGVDLLASSDLDWDPTARPMPGEQGGGYTAVDGLGFAATFTGDIGGGPWAPLVSPTVQRSMPISQAPTALPVVTTPGWGEAIRPEGTTVLVGPTELDVAQVGTIAVVPGNPDPAAALVDLPTLQSVLLRSADDVPAITQVWVDAGDRAPSDVAAELRTALGPVAEITATGESVTDAVAAPAPVVYWVAAACALLLALPAIAAVAMTQATSRRGEVVVLRAVGVAAAQQGRSRTRELLGLELGAVVAGVLAGWLLSLLVMVPLIRSTTPQISTAVPLQLTFAVVPGALLVGVVVATVAAVALWYGARVRAQARDTTWREEIR